MVTETAESTLRIWGEVQHAEANHLQICGMEGNANLPLLDACCGAAHAIANNLSPHSSIRDMSVLGRAIQDRLIESPNYVLSPETVERFANEINQGRY
jgi:hypothetical protein